MSLFKKKVSKHQNVAQKSDVIEQANDDGQVAETSGTQKASTSAPRKKAPRSLTEDLLNLILKIAVIVGVFWLLFLFVFGLQRVSETGMSPSIKPEDLIMYYRLDKSYEVLDPVILKVGDEIQVRRVMARAGDVVDVTEKGLTVNGSLQSGLEKDFVRGETLPYKDGITYPVTLKQGEIFVLGDNREDAEDSRVYGPVKEKNTLGTLMWDLRRRNL